MQTLITAFSNTTGHSYHYTPDGKQVSNITEWGLQQFRERYGDDTITAEDIFAYTYAMLHDPVYRELYVVDLQQEFPRVYFHENFAAWRDIGRELLELHTGFESAEPWPLERVDLAGEPRRVMLKANKEQGSIALDDKTTLRGVPAAAWQYRLGSRSALEWVLDQYKERKPRDPTITDRFNTYRFTNDKEKLIGLLRRVCTISVNTVEIVGRMAQRAEDEYLAVGSDNAEHEWETLGLAQWFGESGGPDDAPEYQAWLAALPDIRDTGK